MARNVEIKARLADFAAAEKAAASLSDGPRTVIRQEDIFFPSPRGRLKLRILAANQGELIYYERPDQSGPKTSEYFIFRTGDPAGLRRALGAAYGERGVVKKERRLYLVDRTRIHLDIVEGLGEFLELEVVLNAGEAPEAGQGVAHALMHKLGVAATDLVQGAYIDLQESDAG